VLRTLLRVLGYLPSLISLGMSSLLYYRIRSPLGLALWPFKVLAGSLAVLLIASGALGALLGLAQHAPAVAMAGAVGAILSGLYVRRLTAPRDSFGKASGLGEHGRAAPPEDRWRAWRLPGRPRPRSERDVPFWTIREGDHQLLCDIWRPPEGVRPTGVAVVYFHSSAWHLADKDVWTRPLFRHLAAEGHVVMDAAYRLCPAVDMQGMLGDAKRAIAWMKANAARYGASPERVVAMGGSAGGHLALLAAYTPGHPDLTPIDLDGADTTVRAVVSCYGLADMRACQDRIDTLWPGESMLRALAEGPLLWGIQWAARTVPGHPIAGQEWKLACLSNPGMIVNLLGGSPSDVPDVYDLASPITHAGPHCPPTLLIQGEHDVAVPVEAAHALHQKLAAARVPVANVVLPQTDHIFDLILPQISPAARVALRDLDRFLALVA
jgi:acetyl esterase/lipase